MTAQQLPADFMKLREARDNAAADAQAFSRAEIGRRLRIKCLELALESQRQNGDEKLSTKDLMARSEAILAFVLSEGNGAPAAAPQTGA